MKKTILPFFIAILSSLAIGQVPATKLEKLAKDKATTEQAAKADVHVSKDKSLSDGSAVVERASSKKKSCKKKKQ